MDGLMLTDVLFALPARVGQWLMRLLGLRAEHMHEWLTEFCPCGTCGGER